MEAVRQPTAHQKWVLKQMRDGWALERNPPGKRSTCFRLRRGPMFNHVGWTTVRTLEDRGLIVQNPPIDAQRWTYALTKR